MAGNDFGTADDTMIAEGARGRTAPQGTHAPQFVQRYRPLHLTWRAVIFFIGGAVVVAGIAMLVLPGPGWLAIIAGLAILATEFFWAQRVLAWARAQAALAAQHAVDPKTRRRALTLLVVTIVLITACAVGYVARYSLDFPR